MTFAINKPGLDALIIALPLTALIAALFARSEGVVGAAVAPWSGDPMIDRPGSVQLSDV